MYGFWFELWPLVVLVVAAILLVQVRGRLDRVEAEHRALLQAMQRLEARLDSPPPVQAAVEAAPVMAAPAPQPWAAGIPDERGYVAGPDEMQADEAPPPVPPAPSVPPPPVPPAARQFDLERFVGVSLPVWLGAIALSLAGFFFVRFAIEAGLFGPELRVIAAALLGAAFLLAAEWVRRNVRRDNGPNIAAALAAAAIATFFATSYVASLAYHLVPDWAGFGAMAATTFLAIALAVTFGQSVAIVGLLGGYLAPFWFSSEQASAPALFGYLTAVFAAFAFAIRAKDWWHLTLPALLGPALWVLAWALTPDLDAAPVSLSAFMIGVPAILLGLTLPDWQRGGVVWLRGRPGRFTSTLQSPALGMLVPMLGFPWLLLGSNGAIGYWNGLVAFAVLAALAGVLAPGLRMLVLFPLVSSLMSLLTQPGATNLSLYVVGFGAVFALAALEQFRRLREPALWASILSLSIVPFFALYVFTITGWEAVSANRYPYALAALVLAAGLLAVLALLGPKIADERARSRAYGALLSGVVALVSFAAVIELDPQALPLAMALELLGLAAIHRRRPLPALRYLGMVVFTVYLVLLTLTLDSIPSELAFLAAPSLGDAPLLMLLVPAVAFLLAATLLRSPGRNGFPDTLDAASVALLALGLYYLLRLSPPELYTHAGTARVFGPEMLVAALAVLGGARFARQALLLAGIGLAALVGLVMILSLVLPVFQFWPRADLGGAGIANLAWLSLGVPSALMLFIGVRLRRDPRDILSNLGRTFGVAAVLCLFALMLVQIREAFHPGALLQGETGEAEHYSYSAGILVFGLVLLAIGIARREIGARAVSLVFVVAATVKVFLFDVSELEGLWRVLSFLAMGLAFLGISWFYARFVFGTGRHSPAGDAASPPPVPGPA